jgi:hypothetical protein
VRDRKANAVYSSSDSVTLLSCNCREGGMVGRKEDTNVPKED